MKTNLIRKAAFSAVTFACTVGLFGSVLSAKSYAQAVQPNTVFGCSIPGSGNREDPFGVGNQPANALIATPANSTVPMQADLAYFSTVGTFTGQARCLDVRNRLMVLNAPENFQTLQGYVFALGTDGDGATVICFRPADGTCASLVNPYDGIRALTPFQGYLVMRLIHGDTSPADALIRLNTNLRTFSISTPVTPTIDESNID